MLRKRTSCTIQYSS